MRALRVVPGKVKLRIAVLFIAALGALEYRPGWRPGEAELVLKVAKTAAEPAVRQTAAYALAGVTLTIPRRPRADGSTPFTAGIVIEGGGLFSSPLAFHTAPDHPDNLLTIPTTGADLGALTLTGPVFRAGIVARF